MTAMPWAPMTTPPKRSTCARASTEFRNPRTNRLADVNRAANRSRRRGREQSIVVRKLLNAITSRRLIRDVDFLQYRTRDTRNAESGRNCDTDVGFCRDARRRNRTRAAKRVYDSDNGDRPRDQRPGARIQSSRRRPLRLAQDARQALRL